MRRGELYRVRRPGSGDPRRRRVFVVVSRQLLLDSRFSTAVCAPIFSKSQGLATQVAVRIDEGLNHDSAIHCDQLVSLPKSALGDYVGRLDPDKMAELRSALAVALGLDE